MLDKQVYDLEKEDLIEHAVWFFPMDDTVEGELTVRPLQDYDLAMSHRLIVKTLFFDSEGYSYVGYIYWSQPNVIEDVQPVLFTGGNEGCITFWNGVVDPYWKDYIDEQQELKKRLPITYQSESLEGLEALSGTIEGLYFIDENHNIQCRKT